MDEAMRSTMLLNNRGVAHLESGRIKEASVLFGKALSASKEIELCPRTQAERPDENDLFKHDLSSVAFNFQSGQGPLTSSGPSDLRFIFHKAFMIPSQMYSVSEYYVTCMFNLALSHHLLALDGEDANKSRFFAATRLYELAYTLTLQDCDEISELLILAIVNNLGQIHKVNNEDTKANLCFSHLLSTLMFFLVCGECGGIESLDVFLSSVMNLLLKDALSAPAA
jgi:hypothetical protein